MKRNYAGYSYLSPFMLWSDLATKTLEMMLASAQVIGHRTGRMALAGPVPNARDRREFALMGQEKIEAGAQSAQAMVAHIMTMSQNATKLAHRGLKPIHAKATANARRLGKR